MSFVCAISNEIPEQPVVSTVSGAIYEKRIIEKYMIENGKDPVSGRDLNVENLVEIKLPVVSKPKSAGATSIPATLKTLQDEWDAIMLHTFTLRQQLQTARQELSHALYQHDAACRVIARLNKEVMAAREALATLKPQSGVACIPQPNNSATNAPVTAIQSSEQSGMTVEIIRRLQEKATILTQERKKRGRTMPDDLITQERIKDFRTLSSHPGLHSASLPGILALDVNVLDNNKILTGGNDKTAVIFNKETEQVVAVLKGHSKKVTKVIYHSNEDAAITASPDSTVRIWNIPRCKTELVLRCHKEPITGLSLHPTGDYILSTSYDKHWAFSDIRNGTILTKVMDTSETGLTTAKFHPDGLIFGTGTEDSQVKIWDLKEQSNVANFPGHVGSITALSFSENGYYLATAANDACVKLWDLRKLKNFKTIPLEENYNISDLCFDESGSYLAVSGSDVRIYLCKQWIELKVFNEHTALATGVRFGKHATYITSSSMDRTLKFYGVD